MHLQVERLSSRVGVNEFSVSISIFSYGFQFFSFSMTRQLIKNAFWTVSASAGHDFNKRNVATCATDMIWHYPATGAVYRIYVS